MSGKAFVIEDDRGRRREVGIEEVERLSAQGDPVGHYALGMAYLYGRERKQDVERGFSLLERAAGTGNPDAKALLLRLYMEDMYAGLTMDRAVLYARDAAAAGIAAGQLYYGIALLDGGQVARDYAKAREMFEAAAAQGCPEAVNSLAYMHMEGLGVARDPARAFSLFREAAEAGNLNAEYQLGACYEFGEGCDRDPREAAAWYGKAAEAGDPLAMERLGLLHRGGEGALEEDPEESFEWFVKAANRGVESAMHMVGLSYLDGYGTERDEGEARKWLALAAQAGYPPSVEMMGRMGGKAGSGRHRPSVSRRPFPCTTWHSLS